MMKWCLVILALAACQLDEGRFERLAPFRPGVLQVHVADDKPVASFREVPSTDPGDEIYISPSPVLTEVHLRKIAVWRGEGETRILHLQLTDDGSALLAQASAANVGKRLAFIVNGKVISAPVLQMEITGGEAVIDGGFTEQEAKQLVVILSGS